MTASPTPFHFVEPGPLVDGDLALVQPNAVWIDDVLAACNPPRTPGNAPSEAPLTAEALRQFLRAAPGGREVGDAARGFPPSYHFWMRLDDAAAPLARIGGGIGLRIANNEEIRLYAGHIGYHVYPPARGRHYAERACRLLLPLARRHGMDHLWITTNPDNVPSRRTIERLGAGLIEIIDIPSHHPFYNRGERAKCRYLLKL